MEGRLKFLPTGSILLMVAMTVLHAQKNVSERQSPGDRPADNPQSTRSVVMGRRGMIATSQPLASAAGLKVLQDGGNAVDAAVAAAAVLAVVEPTMTGIGGDLFAIVYDARTKTMRGLNASGRSGHASTPEGFSERGLPAVPGSGVDHAAVGLWDSAFVEAARPGD